MQKGVEYTYRPYIPQNAIRYISDVLSSGLLAGTCRRYVAKFEELLSKYLGARSVIATSSGSTALLVALKALGIGPGHKVLVPAFTFVATATSVLYANAVPVFVDIELETLGIDPVDLEKKLTPDTTAVMVVHVGGVPARIDEILKICKESGVLLVEDCAQALGAEYRGRKVGTFGDASCLSFYPTKTITTGEGGAVVTDRDDVAERARMIVNHGETKKYYHELLGFNFRMSELNAALGVAELELIDDLVERRRRFAKTFIEEVERTLSEYVTVPRGLPCSRPCWNLVQMLLNLDKIGKSRDYVLEKLHQAGLKIFTVSYPYPLYRLPIFAKYSAHGSLCPWRCAKDIPDYARLKLPNVEYVCERVLTLLVSPVFSEEDATIIARMFAKVIRDITS